LQQNKEYIWSQFSKNDFRITDKSAQQTNKLKREKNGVFE
jgi:hypothetical protein